MDIQIIKDIAQQAGEKILDIYHNEDFSSTVDFKADDSPLTIADKAAHIVIMEGLTKAFPEIPVMSEEGRVIEYSERKDWSSFWCVDPLDGTKEFIKKNGQFTVNIALIQDGYPVLGVVYVPVTGESYYSDGEQSFLEKDGEVIELHVNNKVESRVAVRSSSHASDEETELLKKYGANDAISVGSSLKFCMVANGKADIYYRHGPTMEWDTASGQAVLEGAGGVVETMKGDRFFYNKEELRNKSFLCKGF
ncbi:3'(2'),5'-bisphosphate nucleotidase CysQ [Cyclobacteriaceae bacterium]|nr:3'(2'),5'-bisphosphate nucleotidase CysQ [Cyclobacteriaceae bacterium]